MNFKCTIWLSFDKHAQVYKHHEKHDVKHFEALMMLLQFCRQLMASPYFLGHFYEVFARLKCACFNRAFYFLKISLVGNGRLVVGGGTPFYEQ